MKTAVVLVLVFCGVALGDLVSLLQNLHSRPSFQHLSHQDQLLVVELLAAAKSDSLHGYIDNVGYDHVLSIADHLTDHEAHQFIHFLNVQLQEETHGGPATHSY